MFLLIYFTVWPNFTDHGGGGKLCHCTDPHVENQENSFQILLDIKRNA